MKENKLTITINKPVAEVFAFTTNPKNTPLWIPSIKEEIADFPPKIGTIYKNRGAGEWDTYKVTELEENKTFTLSDGNYFVRYSYKKRSENETEIQYFEWVVEGDLEKPFTVNVIENLKIILEK